MKSVHKIHIFSPSGLSSKAFWNQGRTSKAFGTSGPHRGNPTSKKARVSSSEEDDEVAQRRNFELLSTAEEGTLSSATYANLVKDTFQMRRKFITQEANSSKEILNVSLTLKEKLCILG